MSSPGKRLGYIKTAAAASFTIFDALRPNFEIRLFRICRASTIGPSDREPLNNANISFQHKCSFWNTSFYS